MTSCQVHSALCCLTWSVKNWLRILAEESGELHLVWAQALIRMAAISSSSRVSPGWDFPLCIHILYKYNFGFVSPWKIALEKFTPMATTLCYIPQVSLKSQKKRKERKKKVDAEKLHTVCMDRGRGNNIIHDSTTYFSRTCCSFLPGHVYYSQLKYLCHTSWWKLTLINFIQKDISFVSINITRTHFEEMYLLPLSGDATKARFIFLWLCLGNLNNFINWRLGKDRLFKILTRCHL